MYIGYVNETDRGCDYTIACGKKLLILESETYEGAVQELKEFVLGTFDPNDRADCGGWSRWSMSTYRFVSVTLYEVSPSHVFEMPINQWYDVAQQMAETAKRKLAEDDERKEFERLKTKFG